MGLNQSLSLLTLIIGNNVYNGGPYRTPFVGKISHVRIWDTNLSDSFIANNYNKILIYNK